MPRHCSLVAGSQLVAALENGVSQWPKLEGRFPQVSGVRFEFDPAQPPGRRVVPGSVTVGGADLQPGGGSAGVRRSRQPAARSG